ncbi:MULTISPECIES: hypothetical protein [Calothrix]|nr:MULTISPECIES: hypothetical protein [Calothrix]
MWKELRRRKAACRSRSVSKRRHRILSTKQAIAHSPAVRLSKSC